MGGGRGWSQSLVWKGRGTAKQQGGAREGERAPGSGHRSRHRLFPCLRFPQSALQGAERGASLGLGNLGPQCTQPTGALSPTWLCVGLGWGPTQGWENSRGHPRTPPAMGASGARPLCEVQSGVSEASLTGGPWAPRAPLGPVTPVGPWKGKRETVRPSGPRKTVGFCLSPNNGPLRFSKMQLSWH